MTITEREIERVTALLLSGRDAAKWVQQFVSASSAQLQKTNPMLTPLSRGIAAEVGLWKVPTIQEYLICLHLSSLIARQECKTCVHVQCKWPRD